VGFGGTRLEVSCVWRVEDAAGDDMLMFVGRRLTLSSCISERGGCGGEGVR
jgi:hypothetical protein